MIFSCCHFTGIHYFPLFTIVNGRGDENRIPYVTTDTKYVTFYALRVHILGAREANGIYYESYHVHTDKQ